MAVPEAAPGPSFKELEQKGWGDKANVYDSFAGQITSAAVEPLLDAAGVREGTAVLDVACGPGYSAHAATIRGARAIGVDFAAPMVAEARGRFPGIEFREGDAENLAFGPESFDAVVCGFGLLHLTDPERAMAEACRVLKPGGRYAFTVWHGPQGHDFFSLVTEAIERHGQTNIDLPAAPPMFRFADPVECERSLTKAGLVDVTTEILPLTWRVPSPQSVLDFLQKCAVRVAMVMERQTAEANDRIHQAILEGAERFAKGGSYELAWPAALTSARKP